MNSRLTSNRCSLQWKLSHPGNDASSALVIILPDWVYGLLPFCGPGLRKDTWMRELSFQKEVCSFFHSRGIETLSLEPVPPDAIPTDEEMILASYIPDVYISIKQICKESGSLIRRSILFGHGFGSRMLCELAMYGLKPAGYIIAGGVYSDIDAILTQKYLPIKNYGFRLTDENISPYLDPDTNIIMNNLGKIFRASRKGKGKIRLKESGYLVDLHLPRELFSAEKSLPSLYSALVDPCLILHGSGDLDVSVSNAFFLETKLRQKISSVSRIVMLDKDHWFREMPDESEERVRQRLTGGCIHNPVDHRFLKHCLVFIEDLLKIRPSKKKPA